MSEDPTPYGYDEAYITRLRDQFKKRTAAEDHERHKPCCHELLKLNIGWFQLPDGRKVMPYMLGKDSEDATKYRVNYCPVCGEFIREKELKM